MYESILKYKQQVGQRFTIFGLSLTKPPQIKFKAGQYISVIISEKIRRPYSITSSPLFPSSAELCIDTSTGGAGATFFNNLKIGDNVTFVGPFGTFGLPETIGSNVEFLFFATGSGIAPIKSHICYLLDIKQKNRIVLYFGTRKEEDLLYKEFFENLQQNHPNFNYYPTLSAPSASWKGFKGYVTQFIDKQITYNANKQVYICGQKEMMQSCINLLMQKGFIENKIHIEKYS